MPQANSDSNTTRGLRKVRQGIVVSNKMDKSIVVKVERTVRHPLYQKVMRRSKNYMAHDEENTTNIGDMVRIVECRPMSRNKRWRLVEVVTKAEA